MKGRLSPHFVEWMQLLEPGWVTDIVTNRPKALRMLGNGVCPLQCAYAYSLLLDRAFGSLNP